MEILKNLLFTIPEFPFVNIPDYPPLGEILSEIKKIMNHIIIDADAIAKMAFEYTGMILGFKLADVVAHTNPEAIFLFGGLALAKDLIFEPAKEYMEENLLSIYKGKVKLLQSELSTQNAAVLGASSLVWSVKEA